MAHGHEDWVYDAAVDIVSQTLTHVAIDIAAQTLAELAVNITAQDLATININIAASDITLDINLKASDITLNVDISAQTIGNLTIDIEAQSVGVYLQPDWQAKEGYGKYLTGSYDDLAARTAAGSVIAYEVPTGKVLYVFGVGGYNFLAASTTYAGFAVQLKKGSDFPARIGGYCGCWASLPTPVKYTVGQTVRVDCVNLSDQTTNVYCCVNAYEVAA